MEAVIGIYIIQAERTTGIVLDVNGKYLNSKEQQTYLFFDSISEAILKAKEIAEANPYIELYVYENSTLIETFNDPHGFNPPKFKKKKWWHFF
jgi:hypothetical protein